MIRCILIELIVHLAKLQLKLLDPIFLSSDLAIELHPLSGLGEFLADSIQQCHNISSFQIYSAGAENRPGFRLWETFVCLPTYCNTKCSEMQVSVRENHSLY